MDKQEYAIYSHYSQVFGSSNLTSCVTWTVHVFSKDIFYWLLLTSEWLFVLKSLEEEFLLQCFKNSKLSKIHEKSKCSYWKHFAFQDELPNHTKRKISNFSIKFHQQNQKKLCYPFRTVTSRSRFLRAIPWNHVSSADGVWGLFLFPTICITNFITSWSWCLKRNDKSKSSSPSLVSHNKQI